MAETETPDKEPQRIYVRWSQTEGRMVPDDYPIPEDRDVVKKRWARVVDGVVMESPMDYPMDPNVSYKDITDPPPTYFLCPDPQVECWWLYDAATQTYSPPLPITDPPLAGAPTGQAETILAELKANPSLRAELRRLLLESGQC
jgi:hypothetical protein